MDAEQIEESAAGSASRGHGRRLAVTAVVCLFAAYGFLYFYSDGRKLLEVTSGLSGLRLLLPIAATLLSYAVMALSYEWIAEAARTPIGFLPMLRITFVSNTVNYIVSTGGLSGFAVRMFFFRQSGIPTGRAVTISFAQGLITNLSLNAFLLLGFYFLLTHEDLGAAALTSAALLLTIFVVLTLGCVVLLVRPRLRRRTLLWISEMAHRLARRWLPARHAPRKTKLWRLQRNIDHGLAFLLSHRRRMLLPALAILLDWVLTIGVLWGCFWAVGVELPFALATIGFAIGILTSMVSLVPGGIGIMEGSMTLVFVGLGLDQEPTVIAVLLFRLIYYGVPFLVSLAFFRGMLGTARRQSDVGLSSLS